MFEVRHSANGVHTYLIEVDRTQQGGQELRYAASVAQVVDRVTGDRITEHSRPRSYYGPTPEEAVEKAFTGAEAGWHPSSRAAAPLAQEARLLFDSQIAPAAMGLRAAGPRLRKLVYTSDDYLVDVRVQAGNTRGDTLILGQITAAHSRTAAVDGARVLLERDMREVARTVTNRLGEFELEFIGPTSDLSLTFALSHGHVLLKLGDLLRRES